MNTRTAIERGTTKRNAIQKFATARPFVVCWLLFLIATSFRWIDSFILRLDERIGELILTKSLGFLLVLVFVWLTGRSVRDIGLRSKFAYKSLLIGAVSTSGALCVGYVVEFILASINGTQPQLEFGAIDPKMGVSGGLLFALFLLGGNFINSFMEEGLFRGVMSRLARIRLNFTQTNWFQAFMFGIWHLPWVAKYLLLGEIETSGELFTQILFNSIPQMLIGLVYGYMYLKTNSLWAPWIAHTISNSASNFIHVNTLQGMDIGLPIRMTVSLVFMFLALFWVRNMARKYQMTESKPWR